MLIIVMVGSVIYGLDRLLTVVSSKVSPFRNAQGPPWVRASRRRLERWPLYLEALLGVVAPFLVAILLVTGAEGSLTAGWRGWFQIVAASGACAGALVLAAWMAMGDPVHPRIAQGLAWAMWIAGGCTIVLGLTGQFANPDMTGALPFLTAFVDYLRGSKARRLAQLLRRASADSTTRIQA